MVKDNSLGAKELNVSILLPASSYIFLSSPPSPLLLPYLVFQSSFLLYVHVERHNLNVHAPVCIFKANWRGITEIHTVETCCIQRI